MLGDGATLSRNLLITGKGRAGRGKIRLLKSFKKKLRSVEISSWDRA